MTPALIAATEEAQTATLAFISTLADADIYAEMGKAIQYGQKMVVLQPQTNMRFSATVYVGKKGHSLVADGQTWPLDFWQQIEQHFKGRTIVPQAPSTSRMTIEQEPGTTVIYVDGSYIEHQDDHAAIGWAFEVWRDGAPIDGMAGCFSDADALKIRNIAGECHAVEKAIDWCHFHNCKTVEIRFDYMGLKHWAEGTWRTSTPLTHRYRHTVQQSFVSITWTKIKAHSGEPGNSRVDRVARTAAETGSFYPRFPVDLFR